MLKNIKKRGGQGGLEEKMGEDYTKNRNPNRRKGIFLIQIQEKKEVFKVVLKIGL